MYSASCTTIFILIFQTNKQKTNKQTNKNQTNKQKTNKQTNKKQTNKQTIVSNNKIINDSGDRLITYLISF
jgi:beta-lactamase regulating signal transducer with metallopeptidase domain